MNALVPIERAPVLAGASPQALVPTSFEGAWRIAQVLAASGMAPRDMQKPESLVVAIMHGLEVGLTPLAAVQSIAVVNGRPTIWGDGAIGLVRASGICEFIKEWTEGQGEAAVAYCETKRKGEKETVKRSFAVADAKKAGLWGKSGPWTQYPSRMLQLRARAFALRDTFADVLRGLAIREEMEDVTASARSPVEPPPAPRHVYGIEHRPQTTVTDLLAASASTETAGEPLPAQDAGANPAMTAPHSGEAPASDLSTELDDSIFDGDAMLAEASDDFAAARTARDVVDVIEKYERRTQSTVCLARSRKLGTTSAKLRWSA
jgi:hypothetical protein